MTSRDIGPKKLNARKFVRNTFSKKIARKCTLDVNSAVLQDGYLGFFLNFDLFTPKIGKSCLKKDP